MYWPHWDGSFGYGLRHDRVVAQGGRTVPIPSLLRPHFDGIFVTHAVENLFPLAPLKTGRPEVDGSNVAIVTLQHCQTLEFSPVFLPLSGFMSRYVIPVLGLLQPSMVEAQ